MTDYDVAVVGAGLAGLHTARRLGERGLKVLLVDAKASVDQAVHTTGIFVRRTLEDFDLPEACLGPPVRRVVLLSPRGRALALDSPRDEFRVGRMGALYRRWLDETVRAGVEWAPRTRYAGCVHGPTETVLLLEDAEGPREARARFVVGADGAASRVARGLGLDENREWIVGVEEVWRGALPDAPPAFHCWLDPVLAPGYIAWVVADGEETHVGVGGHAARFRPAEALKAFHARVAERFGIADRAPDERRGGRIPVGGVLANIANRRGLLVGDAAGAVSPLTAGGLDPCLRLSELAAHVAVEYVATGDEAALLAYSGARFRAHFRKRIAMRRALSSIRSPLLAEAACAGLRLPGVRAAAHGVFFGRGSFPDVAPRPSSRTIHESGELPRAAVPSGAAGAAAR
ncbi:MAG TPA: NAD(P)/FAD-dependent oxidoreductase [Longimicrobium sp.]|nr:NAD(P)/FAD-dependent oxidoreductase [Longimicrobium sp.]